VRELGKEAPARKPKKKGGVNKNQGEEILEKKETRGRGKELLLEK